MPQGLFSLSQRSPVNRENVKRFCEQTVDLSQRLMGRGYYYCGLSQVCLLEGSLPVESLPAILNGPEWRGLIHKRGAR